MKDLDKIFESFETGIRNGKAEKPKEYLRSIGLDYSTLRIGFNSGQFHHRKPQELRDHFEQLGLLTKSEANVRSEELTAYTVFGKDGLIFPLTDKMGKIVNYFAIRFKMAIPKEDYLNNEGLYPSYPHASTKRLFLTPTLIDTASLLQSKALDQRESVLALHNGKLLHQHIEALGALQELQEIILIKR